MKPSALHLITILVSLASAGWGNAQESIILLNPSFEEQTHFGSPPVPADGSVFVDSAGIAGAGNNPATITAWTYTGSANHGVNNADIGYPFADNGRIPDSGSVAFLQQPGTLSQNVAGLDPTKQYWLQFYVNSRNSINGIPGNAGIPNGRVEFAGAELIPPLPVASLEDFGVRTQEWVFINVPFTPAAATGDLVVELTSLNPAPVGGGTDGALVFDAFSLIQRHPNEIVIQNPSFEASGLGTPFPGTLTNIAGWNALGGGVGTNPDAGGVNAFADNGLRPDGNNVAYIQGPKTLGQTVNNLTVDREYEISFSYNARAGDDPGDPNLEVTLGANTILNSTVTPVGGVEPYHRHSSFFTAANESELLTFAQTAGGDNSILLDNVKITDLGSPVEYTIDEVLSTLTLTGTIQGETANGQGGPGGRTTHLEGTIAARLNDNTLSFRGGSDIDAKLNPNAPFDPAGTGEDNFGVQTTLFGVVNADAVLRDVVADLVSGSADFGGDVSELLVEFTDGKFDFDAGLLGSDSDTIVGESGLNESTNPLTRTINGNVETVTIPILFTLVDPDYELTVEGQIVASRTLLVPGDFDGDGDVDGADLAKWQSDFGIASGSDADGDADSDGADFLIWQRNLTGSSVIAVVPEPSGLVLLSFWVAFSVSRPATWDRSNK